MLQKVPPQRIYSIGSSATAPQDYSQKMVALKAVISEKMNEPTRASIPFLHKL